MLLMLFAYIRVHGFYLLPYSLDCSITIDVVVILLLMLYEVIAMMSLLSFSAMLVGLIVLCTLGVDKMIGYF